MQTVYMLGLKPHKGIFVMRQQIVRPDHEQGTLNGGLPMRTHLRAGITLEEIQQGAQSLWDKLAQAAGNILPGSSAPDNTAAS
jgi:hypothetical protein